MNIYDYRTIPPEESAYHARTSHGSEYGDDDIPKEDLVNEADDEADDEASDYSSKNEDPSDPKSTDFGARRKPYK